LVYCKITNRLTNGGTTLEQKGRCAVASNAGPLSGVIAAHGQGRYAGTLDSSSTVGPAQLSGSGGNASIALNAAFVDRRTNRATKSVIRIALLGDGKYRLTSTQLSQDGKSRFVASDIMFVRH
jgi:hypothetical protein